MFHASDDEPVIKCLWNLKDYLPPALQEPLNLLLSEFVYLPWKHAETAGTASASGEGSQALADGTAMEEAQTAYLQSTLMSRFTDRLLSMVAEVQRKVTRGNPVPIAVLASSTYSRLLCYNNPTKSNSDA